MALEDKESVGSVGSEAIFGPESLLSPVQVLNSGLTESIIDTTYLRSHDDIQNNIWISGSNSGFQDKASNEPLSTIARRNWFISSFPAGTDTAILPQLALRINSSIGCQAIPTQSFPEVCPGPNPFEIVYSYAETAPTVKNHDTPSFDFSICVPGDSEYSPWGSGRDRQDISEEMYLSLYQAENITGQEISLTYHCVLNTTAGYFELPNYWDNHAAGNILADWPEDEIYQDDYFGIFGAEPQHEKDRSVISSRARPLLRTKSRTRRNFAAGQGPLIITALAIFGNGTFFNTLALANDTGSDALKICNQLYFPFPSLFSPSSSTTDPAPTCSPNGNGLLASALLEWLSVFMDSENLEQALTVTMFSVCNALVQPDWWRYVRTVYASPGTDVLKPNMSPIVMIMITSLIALQVFTLLGLAIYASTRPTWTESLDSFAVLRLGAAMAADLPIISPLEDDELAVLDEKEGWIGQQEGEGELKRLVIGGSMNPMRTKKFRLVESGEKLRLHRKTQDGRIIKVYQG